MSLKVENSKNISVQRLAILVGGDLLVMLALIWWGRSEHQFSVTDVSGGLFTAAPFIISWFAVTPWFGLFRADVSQTWQKLVPRLLLAWAIGEPLALVLRALFLGRPIPEGIIPIFALVMLATTTPAMLLWRLAYAWWAGRQSRHLSQTAEPRP